jgi:zinc transport system permease protein
MSSAPAIVLALLAALAAGIAGAFAQMRRMALAGDAVSHIALPGLGLAMLFGIHPLLGAASTLLFGTLLVWLAERRTGLQTEAIIGVVFTTSLAVGALVTPNEDLIEALFGGFRKPSILEFIFAASLSLVVLAGLARWKDALVLNLFSQELAAATGLNRARLDLIYLALFSATVLLGLRFLGSLLAGALIVIPAAAARQWARRLGPFLALSAALSLCSVAAGIAIAQTEHVAEGPVVVSVASAAFVVSLATRRSLG